MAVPPELHAATRHLRAVRARKPEAAAGAESFAAWREEVADALDRLAGVLIFEEDRRRARSEAAAARAEAASMRKG